MLSMGSPYRPQTDDQTEVTNRSLEQYLRCFVYQNPKRWEGFLPWAEYWYNTTYHASTKRSPFEYLYGRQPPTLVSYTNGASFNDEVDRELQERDELIQELKVNLEKANNRMKAYYDQGHREEQFEPGDWVYLKIRPHRQKSVTQKALYKLGSRFYGPYQVLKKIGKVAYKLDLPTDAQIHPVIHVSQLKRRLGDQNVVAPRLPDMDEDGNIMLRPQGVLEYRRIKRGSRFRWEVLIQWDTLPREEATWEDLTMIRTQFPNLVLEDKDILQGDGNDEDQSRRLKNAYNRARRLRIKEGKQSMVNQRLMHVEKFDHEDGGIKGSSVARG